MSLLQPTRLLGIAASTVLAFTASASAQSSAGVLKEIEALKERISALESQLQSKATNHSASSNTQLPTSAKAPIGGLDDIDAEFMGDATGFDGWWERTSIGGYGEMHLNLGDSGDQIDFHRWVLYINHDFSDRLTLVSELELEHSLAGDGKNGEVELEQAYVDYDFGSGIHGKAGLFLVPVGILNEVHEPDTFFGTERNPVEKEIIPSTWWEGGLALTDVEGAFQWDLAFHSALVVPSSGSNAYRIRSGRQKVSEADASEWASTARVKYKGIPGLELSLAGQYQSDLTPGRLGGDDSAYFGTAHIDYRIGGFGLRALGGYWDIDGEQAAALGTNEQWGWYVEPSYTFRLGEQSRLGVFARYNQYEYAKGEIEQIDLGLNYWPMDNVVFKADVSRISQAGQADEDILNFGFGYQF